jgi:hypothetical protein
MEENPPDRKLRPAKKEEDFSANALKKMPAKKIPFQIAGFDPFPFHRWQSVFGHAFTNDVLRNIVPALYKVDDKQTTAVLVEFPPIKVKLKGNGGAQKLER